MRKLSTAWRNERLRYMLLAGAILAGCLLLLWRGQFFMETRLRLNDIYYAPAQTSDNIIIIGLDDASLARYGRTPAEWPREVYAELVDALAATNARVVAIDLLFSETDPDDDAFAAALADLRSSEARTRIVLAGAGVNIAADIGDDPARVLPFAFDLPLSPPLAERADYRGYANALADIDGVVRRQPSLVRAGDDTAYTFSIATYLTYLRIPATAAEQIVTPDGDDLLVTAERRLPVDEFGMWQFYYFGPPAGEGVQTFPVVSLLDVIDGETDPALFDDKIVLVGLINTTGMLDQYLVPASTRGSLMSGIEIQANAIESLLQNRFIFPLADIWQGGIIVLLAVGASLIYALPRWYFKIALAVALIVGWVIFASVFFSATDTKINLFDTLLALSMPLLISTGIDITQERLKRQQKEFLLGSLQRIAEQRMRLGQAAEYILEDVGQIAPGFVATLYIRASADTTHFRRFRHNEMRIEDAAVDEDTRLRRYVVRDGVIRDGAVTVIPLTWQNREQGMLHMQHSRGYGLDAFAERRLKELTTQLAPHIDNMLLYEEIQRQKTLLDTVFSESPAGIAIVDKYGRVIQYNQDLALLLEASHDDIKGRMLPELLAAKAEDERLARKLAKGIQTNEKFNITGIELGERSIRIDVAPLAAYELWTIITGDVTALVELNKLKTQMLRMASHDLKNPLARVIGFAEVLELQEHLQDTDRRYTAYIKQAGDEMLHIINDFLDLERLRSGKPALEDIDLTQLAREVCASHQPDTIQKKLEFTLDMPDAPVRALADTSQISQAITNLVGNAIKYTPEGGAITVRLEPQNGEIRFSVEDTGYGIPKDAQDKLFTEFYRVKSGATLHIAGTGLGLSLARAVIKAHDGEIGFISAEGVGSTFYFTLPEIQESAKNAPEPEL